MANVKISELPALVPNGKADDVIIVNEAASGTTCKSTLAHLLGKNITVSGTPYTHLGQITWTQGGETLTSFDTIINRITPVFARVRLLKTGGAITITNNDTSNHSIELVTGLPVIGVEQVINTSTFTGDGLVPQGVTTDYDLTGLEWAVGSRDNVATLTLYGIIKYAGGIITRNTMMIAPGTSVTMNVIDVPFYAYSTTGFQ